MDTTQKPRMSPKDFFLNLGAMIALYASTFSLLNLLFEIINRIFIDPLSSYYYTYGVYTASIRWSIAVLIIIFPLYLLISYFLNKDLVLTPEKRDLGIRRWLTYFTLFLAGIAIVIDLITLIKTFLGGEITTRFVWKVIAVFVIAGIVFWYYINDIRGKQNGKTFAYLSGAVVLATIIGGFVVVGSPVTARNMRFDEQRVQDLSNIQYQIINYWQQKGKIPTTPDLSELKDSISGYVAPKDSQTGKAYEYQAVGQRDFKLCATFNLPSSGTTNNTYTYGIENNWNHGAGYTCFDKSIDPELYPVRNSIPPVPQKPIR